MRDEQRVVVAKTEGRGFQVSVALAGGLTGQRLGNQAAAQDPTRSLIQRGPQIGNGRVLDGGGILGSDRGGAACKTGAIGSRGAAERGFKEGLYCRRSARIDREVGLGKRVGEGLAPERGHVRHRIQVEGEQFVADHAANIADFHAHRLIDLALQAYRHVIGAFRPVLRIVNGDIGCGSVTIHARKIRLRQRRGNRRQRSGQTVRSDAEGRARVDAVVAQALSRPADAGARHRLQQSRCQ